jgi:ubiquinone biosynthesis protein
MPALLIDLRRALVMLMLAVRLALGLLAARRRGTPKPEVLIRQTLQELGMTGLKLGQFLALRADLLPLDVCRELGKLFETVAPMGFSTVRDVIETDLGEPLSSLFSEFETESIAAASVAQVHIARNRDGQMVAVKVQRPGLLRQFDADMRNLNRLAATVDLLGVMGEISLVEVIGEFAKYTRRELDFVMEGQTAERLRASAVCGEIVPRIYWGLSSHRVLTMEFIEGVSLAKASALLSSGREAELLELLPDLDIREVLHNLAFASLHQLYIIGFFHADPHPGNILICPGNRIAFLDFGIFGEVSPMQKEILTLYLEELIKGNLDQTARYYARLYLPTERTEAKNFQRDARAVLSRWYEAVKSPDKSFKTRMLAKVSDEMLTAVRRNHLRPSIDIVLFTRGLVVMDATILQLCQNFDLLSELHRFFAKFRPGAIGKLNDMLSPEPNLPTLLELALTSASSLNEMMESLTAGRFELSVTVRDSAQAARRENRRVKRIVMGLMASALMMLTRLVSTPAPRWNLFAAAGALLILALAPWRK